MTTVVNGWDEGDRTTWRVTVRPGHYVRVYCRQEMIWESKGRKRGRVWGSSVSHTDDSFGFPFLCWCLPIPPNGSKRGIENKLKSNSASSQAFCILHRSIRRSFNYWDQPVLALLRCSPLPTSESLTIRLCDLLSMAKHVCKSCIRSKGVAIIKHRGVVVYI